MYNLGGQLVLNEPIVDGSLVSLDTHRLAAGIYLIYIEEEGETKVVKVMIY